MNTLISYVATTIGFILIGAMARPQGWDAWGYAMLGGTLIIIGTHLLYWRASGA